MFLPLLALYIYIIVHLCHCLCPSQKPNSQHKKQAVMEVVIPTRTAMDFDFNSARSSPCVTAPSTPRRFGEFYMSAPTSPTRMSDFYREFEEFSNSNWEDDEPPTHEGATPKSPKSPKDEFGFEDFAFDVSEEVERTSLSAEELFDGGVIRPFKPPPATNTPRTPSFFRQVLSPRWKKGKDHPLGPSSTTQMDNTTKRSDQHQRGRDRTPAALSSSVSGHRATRSLSPLRVSEYQWEEEEKQQQQQQQQQNNRQLAPKAMFSPSAAASASKASKKWKLRDFLLFRSASEGRATDKDPFRKYSNLFKKNEDVKNSSFRSIDSPAATSSRRRGPVSAHELHYTMNKAVSNDMKKKTFLPYKQGILGRLAFNPAVSALANGFGSLSRS
ncbi:uncharacterized protein LOC117629634 [Prunus dulcis]|nr:uncharacterized protein LOC117629634 [Prunus dulcis]